MKILSTLPNHLAIWSLAISGVLMALPTQSHSSPPALKVVGNHLETLKGKTVRLQGVNIPSLDFNPEGARR